MKYLSVNKLAAASEICPSGLAILQTDAVLWLSRSLKMIQEINGKTQMRAALTGVVVAIVAVQ